MSTEQAPALSLGAEPLLSIPLLICFVSGLAFFDGEVSSSGDVDQNRLISRSDASMASMVASSQTGMSQRQVQRLLSGGANVLSTLGRARALVDDAVGADSALSTIRILDLQICYV